MTMTSVADARARRPLVSVVVVHWNTPGLLRTCLDALTVSAGSMPYEILVVDNGSRKDLRPDVRSYRRLKLTTNAYNRGFAAAANQAAALARGPYLLFLNPDAVLADSALAHLVRALRMDARLAAAAALAYDAAGRERFPGMRFLGPLNHALSLIGLPGRRYSGRMRAAAVRASDVIVEVDWARASTLLVRAEVFRALGGFDEGFFFYEEDEDWCWRARRRGHRIGVVPQAHTRDPGGASAARAGAWIETALYEAQLRFVTRRAGRAGAALYRIAVSVALLVRSAGEIGRSRRLWRRRARAVLRFLWKPTAVHA